MARQPTGATKRVSFQVSTAQRPDFKHPLAAYIFDASGLFVDQAEVRDGRVELPLSPDDLARARVFIAPVDAGIEPKGVSAAQLERLGAYEPVLQTGGKLIDRIDVAGPILDIWPFCFCWVRGKVVRASDNLAVCNARVHICEVDRIPWWILRLPDPDIFRLRDDLIEILRNPPIPIPEPGPDPWPFRRQARRFAADPASRVSLNPQPLPPRSALRFAADAGSRVSLNPQPLPPSPAARFAADLASRVSLNPQPLPPGETITLAPELHASLHSRSSLVVRDALVRNWKLLLPWFCHWPHWWWWFRCDEIRVIETDTNGRFETTIFYRCDGDHPDLYFWVEYDLGAGFETVYHPTVACHTYWDYACGSEVTIRITDPRVPGCGGGPDLPGRQVRVMSIGLGIAVREVGADGLTNFGEPFGGTLEPRVDFSRSTLISANIPYYRWSYRRLTGPDGVNPTVDPGSPPIGGTPSVMTREVYRHYEVTTGYQPYFIGPLPITGTDAAPLPNLFRIWPASPPAGAEWKVVNENIDMATAYFETASLPGGPVGGPPPEGAPWTDDLSAGLYEITLELFDTAGTLVNWTAKGIELNIAAEDAPFGVGALPVSAAPPGNRILVSGDTMGFRMTVRVDNNRCFAEILSVGGTVTPDPICGFHNYSSPSDSAGLSFIARHPNGFAGYSFATARGTGPVIAGASTSGRVGAAGTNGFTQVGGFTYAKDVVIGTLLGACSNAAFSERLDVGAMATDGYSTLSGYNAADNAAFALAIPCPDCDGNPG